MKDSSCANCGGKLHSKKTTMDRIIEGHLYLFEKVPVQVCEQCSEIWIPAKEAERMDNAILGKIKPLKRITVPVY